jgi:hypothetical protein
LHCAEFSQLCAPFSYIGTFFTEVENIQKIAIIQSKLWNLSFFLVHSDTPTGCMQKGAQIFSFHTFVIVAMQKLTTISRNKSSI